MSRFSGSSGAMEGSQTCAGRISPCSFLMKIATFCLMYASSMFWKEQEFDSHHKPHGSGLCCRVRRFPVGGEGVHDTLGRS